MKHATKEMLKTIISNQHLIMKALKIEVEQKETIKKSDDTKAPAAKAAVKTAAKKPVKKAASPAVKKPVRK